MKKFLILAWLMVVNAEAPTSYNQQSSGGVTFQNVPSIYSTTGGLSDYQSQQYGSQQNQPSSIPANIQVSYGQQPPSLPQGSSYGPPPIVTGAGPDHDIEYRIVYKPVKAPKPDIVLPPPPPKQKTIVYILVPRVEAPEPIIVPTHAPTAPSKPEVYFIRYKAGPKKKNQQQQYGAASEVKGVVASNKSDLFGKRVN